MGGWLRSRHTADAVRFPARMHRTERSVSIAFDSLGSSNGCLVWGRAHEGGDSDPNEEVDLGPPYPTWRSSPAPPSLDLHILPSNWVWRFGGFGVWRYVDTVDGVTESSLFVPYWSLTVPLTLLSAYLILWKPRKQKTADQTPISNLISN